MGQVYIVIIGNDHIISYNSFEKFHGTNIWEPHMTVLSKPVYSKTRVKRPLSKRPKIGFQDQCR